MYGRAAERAVLLGYATSNTATMVAVVGRRRVGKTYLIRRTLENIIDFEITGYQYATKTEQLQNFILSLAKFTNTAMITQAPKNWLEAFHILKNYLSEKKQNKKKIIFIDELPWMASSKSGFVEALAHFWNDWASENNVLLVVCGSAASWMLKNVVHNKGGLHNRIQHTIHLQPFTLKECKEYLMAEKIAATDKQITEMYMVLGGIPYYLSLMQRGKSLRQNIEELLFDANGKLRHEFNDIFVALFNNSNNHLQVIGLLAKKTKGLTRLEIAELYHGNDGGGLSQILEELMLSGFIGRFDAYGKAVKEALYRITDPYILFYKKYLATRKTGVTFEDIVASASFKSWSGYAFENICLYHIKPIQKKLHSAKITSYACTYLHKGTKQNQGYQIDLLIDRSDGVINICELKFYEKAFAIDKKYAQQLQHRLSHFESQLKKKKSVQLTFITANGMVVNEYAKQLIDKQLLLTDWL